MAATASKPRVTAKARRAQQAAEYGQWEAAVPVNTLGGVLAYAPGHPVPASNVEDDGRVILARHQCDEDPTCPGGIGHRCERFNEPTAWTAPGAARRIGEAP